MSDAASTVPSHSSPSPPPAPAPAAKMPWKARLWKISKRVLRSLALIYCLVCLVMYFLQTYLVFPGTFRQGSEDTRTTALDGETLVALKTPAGVPLAGIFGAADLRHHPELKEMPRPTVLFFYGNGDSMVSARATAEVFRGMGYHAIIVDYAGFGMSGGKASEQGCYDAAEAAYQYVLTRPDVDPKRLVSAGWSLGGGVAVDLAYRHRDDGTMCGLMTFSTFTSVVDMGRQTYPFLPISLMLKHRFMSIDKVPSLRMPYFLGHGKADNDIPYSHADRLAAAYGDPAQLTRYISPKAEHVDFFDVDLSELEDAMGDFLQRATR